jgi:glucose/arabinose dehydrogenase
MTGQVIVFKRIAEWMVAGGVIQLAVIGAAAPPSPEAAAQPSGAAQFAEESLPPGGRIEFAAAHARNPTAMAFAPDGRWFYTERTTGYIFAVTQQFGRYNLFPPVPATHPPFQSEQGLLGIALDPNFLTNKYIYVYYTSGEDAATTGRNDNRVVRYTMVGNDFIMTPTLMLTAPLQSNDIVIHNGGNLHFGPDGKLYVSIGDYFDATNGQNLNRLQAKIHRFNTSVPLSAPADNPFFSNPNVTVKSTYAYGFRNPFDFDFDPVTGAIFAGDNGIACDDEINRVLPGYNYGWRANYPDCDDFSADGPDPAYNTIPPLIAWPYSAVPTGVTFYRGDLFPEWQNDLFACHWKDGTLHRFRLDASRTAIASHTILVDPNLGATLCHLDIETGTDGALYFFRNDETDPSKEFRDIYRITRDPTIYASTFAPSSAMPASGDVVTYTMRLAHYSPVSSTFAITATLPPSTTIVAGSPQAGGGAIGGSGAGIFWSGVISSNTTLTATYRVTVSQQIGTPALLANTMTITTDKAGSAQRAALIFVNARGVYLPIAFRAFEP